MVLIVNDQICDPEVQSSFATPWIIMQALNVVYIVTRGRLVIPLTINEVQGNSIDTADLFIFTNVCQFEISSTVEMVHVICCDRVCEYLFCG